MKTFPIFFLILIVGFLSACSDYQKTVEEEEDFRSQYQRHDDIYKTLPELNLVPVAQVEYRNANYFLFDLPDEKKRCIMIAIRRGGGPTCWYKE